LTRRPKIRITGFGYGLFVVLLTCAALGFLTSDPVQSVAIGVGALALFVLAGAGVAGHGSSGFAGERKAEVLQESARGQVGPEAQRELESRPRN
jgi:uncharacterized membrane protein